MEKNLILTGWGYPEYVASAAVALKALGGRADVRGVSRRRLPELLDEIGSTWPNVYLLGVSLSGDVPALAAALRKLKSKNVKVMWISAFGMPDEFRDDLGGLLNERVYDGTLLEAVGQTFKGKVNVRLITATNRNLPERVHEGKFREDLYMRLGAIKLHVRRVFDKYGQNLSRTAQALDVSRNTVRKYL